MMKAMCNDMMRQFLALCDQIRVPISLEKTVLACSWLIFLGILLDGRTMTLAIPIEKKDHAVALLNDVMGKKRLP